jgi:hypothetical protein
MLAAYFCHSRLSQVEFNCALIKVDWLAACITLRVVFQPMGSKGQYLKKCPQPLLTSKKQENLV